MNNAAPQEAKMTGLDIRMAISVFLCVLTATVLNSLGIKFTYGKMKLEIIQKMTAAISCMLVCPTHTFKEEALWNFLSE